MFLFVSIYKVKQIETMPKKDTIKKSNEGKFELTVVGQDGLSEIFNYNSAKDVFNAHPEFFKSREMVYYEIKHQKTNGSFSIQYKGEKPFSPAYVRPKKEKVCKCCNSLKRSPSINFDPSKIDVSESQYEVITDMTICGVPL